MGTGIALMTRKQMLGIKERVEGTHVVQLGTEPLEEAAESVVGVG